MILLLLEDGLSRSSNFNLHLGSGSGCGSTGRVFHNGAARTSGGAAAELVAMNNAEELGAGPGEACCQHP